MFHSSMPMPMDASISISSNIPKTDDGNDQKSHPAGVFHQYRCRILKIHTLDQYGHVGNGEGVRFALSSRLHVHSQVVNFA